MCTDPKPDFSTCRVLAAGAVAAATGWFTPIVFAGCPGAVIEIFLLQGDNAPGAGANFQSFDRPNISEIGLIGFGGDTDAATNQDDIVYVDLMLIAQEGDPAAGVPGGGYGSFEFFETAHQINVTGEIAYIVNLTGVPTSANRAVYKSGALIAREGDPAPGIPGRLYVDFGFAGVADDGSVGYLADLDGSTSDDSVIYFDGSILYRQGQPVPGMPGETWDGDFDEIQWNGNGDLLFEGNTSMPGSMDMVVFRRRTTKMGVVQDIVAQEGQAIDANTGPDFLELILQTALAENGQWALRGNLGVAMSDFDAVILSEVGFYAQQGDPVPELAGVVLGNFNGININSGGDVLYLADLQGATPPNVEEGLFINRCLLVTDGMQVPGLPNGTLFTDIGFEDLYINDNRRIVFQASYSAAGGPVEDGLFIIALDPSCPWDLNGSGDVDVLDLLKLLVAWGTDPGGPPDFDGDGNVGITDLLVLLAHWGPCP